VKTLLLLRHAKAETFPASGDDHGRALTPRGRGDATQAGEQILASGVRIDHVVSSDARRARETAARAAASLGLSGGDDVTLEPRIYDAEPDDLLDVIRTLPDAADAVLLVGHNPGMSEVAARLAAETLPLAGLPTAACVVLAFDDAATWEAVRPGAGRVTGVLLPSRDGL
jgi:phosphohistidine phosphatase